MSGTPAINTRAAAEEDEIAAVQAYREGRYVEPEAPTLAAVEEDYLAKIKLHRSPGLYENRVSHLAVHLKPKFGRTRLDRIEPRAIDRFTKAMLDEKYAIGSINQVLKTLSSVLTWAKGEGMLREPVKVPFLEEPDDSLEEVEHLEQAELDALVARATGQLRRMIVVAAYAGLRAGELVALQWSDVSFPAKRLTVRRNHYRGADRPPKGKKARDVPLCATALAALAAQRHERAPQVFCRDDGTRITYDHAYQLLSDLGASAGWHTLRHTFGTLLSARGVPLKAIQQWMGHKDIKTTMIYARYSQTMDEAIHVLDTRTAWQPDANAEITPPDPPTNKTE